MQTDHAQSGTYKILKDTAFDAPETPGVYVWRDDEGCPIYVGKAKNLRKRLSSYFSGGKDIKTATLVKHASSIETIIVSNEYEALLLENTLIKQHTPKYNINLKDGKTYPVVRITADEFPRVFKTRHIVEDGSLYFGPFPSSQAIDAMLSFVEKVFPLRKCIRFKKRTMPCMYFHIGRCAAPCCGKISTKKYAVYTGHIIKLLSGETEKLIIDLSVDMHRAARAMNFEKAALLRDTISAVEAMSVTNAVTDFDTDGRDYIAWASSGILTTFSVFSMRQGKLVGRELFCERSAANEDESLETFLTAYYSPGTPPPLHIYLPPEVVRDKENFNIMAQYFTDQFGFAPELRTPDSKLHIAALAMARQNAEEDVRKRLKQRGFGPGLDDIKTALSLKSRPVRIEGFDIAQLDGKHPVASLISFKNGVPDKKNYRYFKLKTVVGIVDDFAAMREAVRRRYSRLVKENTELPDLILIDGGIGQVNAAQGVLKELGLNINIAGLAKRDEEIWLPYAAQPIKLSRNNEGLKILQAIRDETHRFATGLNQRLRSKDIALDVLESIDGIGKKRADKIIKEYRSLTAIAEAGIAEISEKCKLTLKTAKTLHTAVRLAIEDIEVEKTRIANQE